MIGAARMWAPRLYAKRYWMKIGAAASGAFQAAWAGGQRILGAGKIG